MAGTNGDSGDWDVDEFLDGYQRRTTTVTIYQRGDLIDEHTRLDAELLAAASDGNTDRARELLERIDAITVEMEATGRTFEIEACPHNEWYELMAKYPPTEADRKAMPGAVVGKAFQEHAIARCVQHPTLTVVQVRKMRGKLRADDFDRLWLGVVTCVEGQVEVPKSELATVVANLFAESSTPPGNRASRRRSSSAAKGGRSPNTSTTRKAG